MIWRWRLVKSTTSKSTMPSVPTPAAACTNAEHACRFQLLLSFHTNLGHDQVARVAQDFVVRKSGGFGFDFNCGGHCNLDAQNWKLKDFRPASDNNKADNNSSRRCGGTFELGVRKSSD